MVVPVLDRLDLLPQFAPGFGTRAERRRQSRGPDNLETSRLWLWIVAFIVGGPYKDVGSQNLHLTQLTDDTT